MSENLTIIVIAFNRPKSLKRLLSSLNKIKSNDKIRLHISIDRAKNEDENNKEVFKVAQDFNWKFGEKIVNLQNENLGLRKHVIKCGNLTEKYENIIMLEDDLVVSPLIYIYAKQALLFYSKAEEIAGFGLYKFERNQYVNEPFYPLNDGSDVFFAQVACSWGQMWSRNQWSKFYNWYLKNQQTNFDVTNMPSNIKIWSEKSWLKYFMKYLVEENKFFVYPQISLTTNFTDVGTHNKKNDISYQTNLAICNDKNVEFRFENLSESNCVYDVFFENKKIKNIIMCDEDIECDFYGTKDINKVNSKLLLSYKRYPYQIVNKFGTVMYPYEQNIINNIVGEDLFLYNLSNKKENKIKNLYQHHLKYIYRIGNMDGRILKNLRKNINKRINKQNKK